MSNLKNKPALLLLLPLMAGIIAGSKINLDSLIIFAVLVVLAGISLVLFLKRFLRLFTFVIATAFLLIGALFISLKSSAQPNNSIIHFTDLPVNVAVQGIIDSPVYQRKISQKLTIRVDTVWANYEPFPVSGKVQVTFYELKIPLKYGDQIVAKGRLLLPSGERNPGEFNYKKLLLAQGILAIMSVNSHQELQVLRHNHGNRFLQALIYPVRRFIIRFIDLTLDGQQAALLKGLLVGARGSIDFELKDAFAKVGVIHVLAVSGLHVGFILLGLMSLLLLLRIKAKARVCIIILGLFYYACLTGLHAPVVRASIMASILLVGSVLKFVKLYQIYCPVLRASDDELWYPISIKITAPVQQMSQWK